MHSGLLCCYLRRSVTYVFSFKFQAPDFLLQQFRLRLDRPEFRPRATKSPGNRATPSLRRTTATRRWSRRPSSPSSPCSSSPTRSTASGPRRRPTALPASYSRLDLTTVNIKLLTLTERAVAEWSEVVLVREKVKENQEIPDWPPRQGNLF